MGFWIFMLIMDLLTPAIMIGFGKLFCKKAPKEINSIFGYRTAMAMKNKETWGFAHHYFGRLWYIWGWAMVPLTAAAMLPVVGRDADTVGSVGGSVCIVQIVPLLGAVILTERALRKNYDKDGNRKEGQDDRRIDRGGSRI